jgi:hypothetical protein
MRTTVDIEKRLLERAKRLASSSDRTLSAVVNAALASYLGARTEKPRDPEFELLVRGDPHGRFPTPAQIAEAEDEDAVAALGISEASRRAAS